MDVILTENVKGLGSIGEVVKVKPRYGRNSLVPQGLAVVASERNLSELEHHKRQLARKAEKLVLVSGMNDSVTETLRALEADGCLADGSRYESRLEALTAAVDAIEKGEPTRPRKR